MEEHEISMMEDSGSGFPHSYVDMENPKESLDPLDPEETLDLVERSLGEPPTKRRYAWSLDIL